MTPILLRWLCCGLFCALLCFQSLSTRAAAIPRSETRQENPIQQQPQRPAIRRGGAIVLAIFLPPVAVVAWQDGVVTRFFWLCLLLTLLGFFPGVIYALYVVSL